MSGVRISWLMFREKFILEPRRFDCRVASPRQLLLQPDMLSDVIDRADKYGLISLARGQPGGAGRDPADFSGRRHDSILKRIFPVLPQCGQPLLHDPLAIIGMDTVKPALADDALGPDAIDFPQPLVRVNAAPQPVEKDSHR